MSNMNVSALNSALSGLNIAQQLLNVTSENIANAQTAGYTAKSLPVETDIANGQVVGVLTDNVTRNVNTALQTSVWQQNATAGSSATINTALQNIQQLYGTANTGSDFSSALTTLQDDFTQLSATPSNTTLQAQTVSDAQSFAKTLNNTAAAVTTARNTAESGIAASVSTINTQLQTIATLNQQIAATQAAGDSTADLEDKRDQAVTTLSSQMNISTYTESTGVMVVQTQSGIALADTSAHTLSFTAQPIGPNSAYSPGSSTGLSGVYVGSGSTAIDLAANPASTGGTLGGLLQLRDQILPQQQAQLDEVAEQTASRFSAQGMKLFTDPSGNIPNTTPASGYVGLASDIQVNSAVVANPSLVQQGTTGGPALDAGDNSVINNVLSYTFGLNSDSSGTPNTAFNVTGTGVNGNISLPGLPAAATLQTFAQDVMGVQANQAASATSSSTYDASYASTLTSNLSNSDGVNLDSEVANLTVYENAYSCSAQVVTTEQKLMTDLLGILQS